MHKKNIERKITVAVMAVFCLCSLFACARKGPSKDSVICSVSYACGHMDYNYSCSFWLREENGAVLFDGEWFDEELDERIELIEKPASVEAVKALRKLADEYDFASFLLKNKPKKPSKIMVMDKTSYGFCVVWDDGTTLNTNVKAGFYTELTEYFKELGKSLYEESI